MRTPRKSVLWHSLEEVATSLLFPNTVNILLFILAKMLLLSNYIPLNESQEIRRNEYIFAMKNVYGDASHLIN